MNIVAIQNVIVSIISHIKRYPLYNFRSCNKVWPYRYLFLSCLIMTNTFFNYYQIIIKTKTNQHFTSKYLFYFFTIYSFKFNLIVIIKYKLLFCFFTLIVYISHGYTNFKLLLNTILLI